MFIDDNLLEIAPIEAIWLKEQASRQLSASCFAHDGDIAIKAATTISALRNDYWVKFFCEVDHEEGADCAHCDGRGWNKLPAIYGVMCLSTETNEHNKRQDIDSKRLDWKQGPIDHHGWSVASPGDRLKSRAKDFAQTLDDLADEASNPF